jgi:hypothetical protein
MEDIKTIDQFCADCWGDSTIETISKKTAKQIAIEFAKYHVELALQAAADKGQVISWRL